MSLDTSSVFKSYSNSASCPADVTVNLKDLKALVGLCCELGADVVLKFDEAGVPLLAVPHAPGVQVRAFWLVGRIWLQRSLVATQGQQETSGDRQTCLGGVLVGGAGRVVGWRWGWEGCGSASL